MARQKTLDPRLNTKLQMYFWRIKLLLITKSWEFSFLKNDQLIVYNILSLKAFSKNWRSLQGKYVLCQYPRARITTFAKETTIKDQQKSGALSQLQSKKVVSNYECRINAFVSDKWVMMNLIFVGQMSLKGSWMFNSSRHRLCTILQTPHPLKKPCYPPPVKT